MQSKIIIVISTIVGLGLAIVITILVPVLAPNYFTKRLDNAGSMENLLKMAGQLNKSLPMMVDKETQLTTVTATENALIYNYTLVNIEKANISGEKLATALKPGMIKRTCSTPETYKSFLKKGISMDYKYYDKKNEFVVEIDIKPSDCEHVAGT